MSGVPRRRRWRPFRIRRWLSARSRKVVWSEPGLPPYVKHNPHADPSLADGDTQPGDLSMGMAAREFLDALEDE